MLLVLLVLQDHKVLPAHRALLDLRALLESLGPPVLTVLLERRAPQDRKVSRVSLVRRVQQDHKASRVSLE